MHIRHASWLLALSILSTEFVALQAFNVQKMRSAVGHIVKKIQYKLSNATDLNNAVVQVFTQSAEVSELEPYSTPQQDEKRGSGFFISPDGLVVTNEHVVRYATAVWIQVPALSRKQLNVSIVGVDVDTDIALLRVNQEGMELLTKELGSVPVLSLGDSDEICRSDAVNVLGYPLGHQGLKSTTGVVSGWEKSRIQTCAAINPGSSGGPLLNEHNQVIGIAVQKVASKSVDSVGYAIPINRLKVLLPDLLHTAFISRPEAGADWQISNKQLTQLLGNPEPGGIYIVRAHAHGFLAQAGIQAGDMIYNINGHTVNEYGHIQLPGVQDAIAITQYLLSLPLDSTIHYVVYRHGQRLEFQAPMTFDVTQQLPIRVIRKGYEPLDYEIVGGAVIQPLSVNLIEALAKEHPSLLKYKYDTTLRTQPVLIVTHVFPNSQARRGHIIYTGDIIRAINGVPVATLEDLRAALNVTASQDPFVVKLDGDFLSVLSLKDIVREEPSLAATYRYTITPGMQQLINAFNEREKLHETQKAA